MLLQKKMQNVMLKCCFADILSADISKANLANTVIKNGILKLEK